MPLLEGDRLGHETEERTPYEILLGEIDHILEEWRALIRSEASLALPPSRLIDSMPEILPGLVRLAREGAVHLDEELQCRVASDHGSARREDEVPIEVITSEWQALKQACRQILARRGIVNGAAEQAVARLDHLIDDAVGYTLRGYYQPELDTLKGRGLERRGEADDRRRAPGDRRGNSAGE